MSDRLRLTKVSVDGDPSDVCEVQNFLAWLFGRAVVHSPPGGGMPICVPADPSAVKKALGQSQFARRVNDGDITAAPHIA